LSLRVAPQPAAEKKSQLSGLTGRFGRLRHSLWRGLRTFFANWIAKPDTLLLIVLACVLRLNGLQATTFLADQAQIYSLGRSALLHHAILVTGIRSSIGTLNMPVSIILLLPFIILGDPFWGTLFTALVNVAAVMLLYSLVNRYVGRRAAIVAGLLYATAPWAVFFSRFIWQQNLLAPVVLLLVWVICLGVLEEKQGWLGWSVLLWGIALQLHPSAAPLLALIAFAGLLTWRRIRWRDLIYAGLALTVLFLPSLFWEIVSKGSDVAAYLNFAGQRSGYDTQVLSILYDILTPPRLNYFGDATLYWRLYPTFAWITGVLGVLYTASVVWLIVMLTRYGRRLLRMAGRTPLQALRSPGNALRAFRSLHALQRGQQLSGTLEMSASLDRDAPSDGGDAGISSRRAAPVTLPVEPSGSNRSIHRIDERFLVIVLLWQAAPILSMLKHPKPIEEHYLLVLLPALFLMIGVFLVWLEEQGIPWVSSWLNTRLPHFPTLSMSEVGKAFLVILAVLTAGQVFASVAMILTLDESAYTGPLRFTYTHYGFPLDVQQDALATAYTTARINHARLYVATTWWQQQSLGYLAAEANMGANVYDAGSCLTMPATGAPAVVLATAPLETTNSLASMPGVTVLQTLGNPRPPNLQAVTDTPALTLYSVPAGSRPYGEIAVPTSATAAGETHLVGYLNTRRSDGVEQLVLHWTDAPSSETNQQGALDYWYGAQPRPGSIAPADYWFMAQPLDRSGHPLGRPSISNCSVLFWGAGDDVYSWLNLQQSGGKTPVASWRVWIARQSMQVVRPAVGGVTLETADVSYGLATVLPGMTTVPAVKSP
jgi:Dolichyl-phosphate-mannose-protein mannosyltransferase